MSQTVSKMNSNSGRAAEKDTELEKAVIAELGEIGNAPAVRNTQGDTGGILHQTIAPEAIEADEAGAPGGGSDLSGGIANLDQTAGPIVDENEYNE